MCLTLTYIASASKSPECRLILDCLRMVRYEVARLLVAVRGCLSGDVPVLWAVGGPWDEAPTVRDDVAHDIRRIGEEGILRIKLICNVDLRKEQNFRRPVCTYAKV